MSEKILVTSALIYANGSAHLGHIAGAYLPADIYVRYNRLIENDVLFICGSDEHGVPITLLAEKEKVSPRTIVKQYHQDTKKAFARLDIRFDNYSGTSNVHNKHHAMLSREFFVKLNKNNFISKRLQDQHYCEKCKRFLADRYVEGTCPKCKKEGARGDECSSCSAQFDPLQLKNPICKVCSGKPRIKSTVHWYLRLDKLQGELEKWIDSKDYWKDNVVNFVKGWFKEGLRERAITRDLYWGVPVPLNDAAGKVLYVWFDAPIGYISSTMDWAEKQGDIELWKKYWKDPERRIVHFIGKDNIPFHAIIWPGILMGQKDDFTLPWHVPANEFLNVGLSDTSEDEEQSKASKSKGNVVWVHDALDVFEADYIRYYLAACAPEKSDTLFTWKDFQQRCNSELLGVLGNLANRALKFTASNFDSKIPQPGEITERDQQMLDSIKATAKKAHKLFANFEVRNAVAEIVSLGRLGNQYFDEKAPWKSIKKDKEDCQTCMYVSAQLVNALAILLSPIVPKSSAILWRQLGHKQKIDNWQSIEKGIEAGHQIHKPEGIFNKIENKTIAQMEEKLAQAIAPAETKIPPLKEETIEYNDFAKLDIRIGEVLEAEKVPKANKLLKLIVNIGSQKRQIIAGIAQHYKPENLIGKKLPVLVNLKPAKIRGLMSEGMILCADINGQPVIMAPGQDVPPGCAVS